MTDRIGWGILGTGHIAGVFADDLRGSGLRLAAVGSRRANAAASFAERHEVPTAHGSYEELVADADVDVVYVASPHPFHAEHAELALRAGKHVLVEKPFTLKADEAERVVELAAERGLVVLEAMWTRWLPHMVRLREILDSGLLGEVRTVIADHAQRLPQDPGHRLQDPALGGGALLDLGIYPVSFAWSVLGEPETVLAHAAFTETGVDRQTAIVLGTADGRQALLQAALDTKGSTRASVVGTDGYVEIDGAFYAPTGFTVYDSSGSVVEVFEQRVERGYRFQALEMERLIRDGGESEVLPPSESVAIMRVMDRIRERIGLRYPSEQGR
ncbi:Gfo/Idh/MocA family protein [Arenivirga flava]|uniref:Oxidoreductase n=1 Tax=Arenivirga flava TaxID=1930060 RepID=A0AA37UFJ4_9MICO|nr:Gfo/Idh/MocA family oxidoreductase [Arenivirga flava]GMA28118.1 oxidoreductase [Arenivirga flava]